MMRPSSLPSLLFPGLLALALLAPGLLGGCAGAPLDRRSWGTEERLPSPPSEGGSAPEGTAAGPAPAEVGPGPGPAREAPRAEAPRGSPAVVALLDTAGQRTRAGRPEEAAAALERALRIEPANPELWARLAEVRLDQGAPRQAEPLALKALGLAEPGDADLRARCHRLVARSRRALGDEAGARDAESRAREAEDR